ncbi:MAG: hypothetical protein L6Q54_08970 [Leptospiraceae bacterium]|nr:hypothetical protein [Leptospiraceae bacterium]MCK6381366.1 hypothetical protein [Leptospiraceae bacterium]NUM42463.1 hypothetical protein [Leptospiraceae bacterium]
MKITKLLLIGFFTISIYCKRDSDVLVTFDNGKVLRSDLRIFYSLKEIPINANTTSIQNQSSIAEDIAIQMISEFEFKKNHPNSTMQFNNIKEVVEKQLVATLWKKQFLEKVRNNSEIEFAESQIAIIRRTNPAQSGIEKADKLLSLLQSLKSDKEISESISQNTEEESRKPLGGLLEPHCLNCGKDPVTENIFGNLKDNPKGQFFKKEIDGNFYIIRINKVTKVKPLKLENYFQKVFSEFKVMADKYKKLAKSEEDKKNAEYYADDKTSEKAKMTAEHILKQYENSKWNDKYQKLKEDSGIKLSQAILPQNQDFSINLKSDTVLFTKKDNSVFTYQNLVDTYEKVNIFKRKGQTSKEEDMKEKIAFLQQILLPSAILTDRKEASEIIGSQKFKQNLEFANRSIAFALIQSDIQNKNYPVTEKELKDTYEMGKLYAYSTPQKEDPTKRTPLPFSMVRDRIVTEVENSKKKAEYEKIINRFKNDYHLKISTENFTAGEI